MCAGNKSRFLCILPTQEKFVKYQSGIGLGYSQFPISKFSNLRYSKFFKVGNISQIVSILDNVKYQPGSYGKSKLQCDNTLYYGIYVYHKYLLVTVGIINQKMYFLPVRKLYITVMVHVLSGK